MPGRLVLPSFDVAEAALIDEAAQQQAEAERAEAEACVREEQAARLVGQIEALNQNLAGLHTEIDERCTAWRAQALVLYHKLLQQTLPALAADARCGEIVALTETCLATIPDAKLVLRADSATLAQLRERAGLDDTRLDLVADDTLSDDARIEWAEGQASAAFTRRLKQILTFVAEQWGDGSGKVKAKAKGRSKAKAKPGQSRGQDRANDSESSPDNQER